MRAILFTISLLAATVAIADPVEPYFGFAIKVGVDWTMDLDEATIGDVFPDSPAAKAGIVKGDSIIDIEGCAVPGCGAYKAKKLMAKSLGEPLHLHLKHADGSTYKTTVIGIAPPARTSAAKPG